MKLIVGLGNPGEKYEGTRHNLGFMVAERFLKDVASVEKTAWNNEPRFKSDLVQIVLPSGKGAEEKIFLVKPKTYMNNSGMAVNLVASYYKIDPSDTWVINDDLDLPLGSMKIRFGGAAAGHHGVESIIGALRTDKFWRFRIGIGIDEQHSARSMREDGGKEKLLSKHMTPDIEDFVLGGFKGREQREVKKMLKHASDALQLALEKGIETAQNRFNTK